MKNPIRTFEANEVGRDFVIGDLHGSLECFITLLEGIDFDPEKDRMFSVGDLVDRGPQSLACLELIEQPWFHCVLANHEQMMVEAFNGGYMGNFWYQNGGAWGHSAANAKRMMRNKQTPAIAEEDQRLMDLMPQVEELPFLITIHHKNGQTFHIIHAELPPGKVVTDTDLSSPGKVEDLATMQTSDGDCFLWGRYLFMPFYKADLANRNKIMRIIKNNGGFAETPGLSHIISGHTIVQWPMTIGKKTNIDTGAYASYPNEYGSVAQWPSLTCIRLDDWQFFQATPTQFREVVPFTVNSESLKGLA